MVKFEPEYLPALAGLIVGAAAGLGATSLLPAGRRLDDWDRRLTVPLLLAAAGAHLALLPAVELFRVVSFSLYFLALLVTVIAALAGLRAWRVGAVIFPAGAIAGYFYFAAVAHGADVIGLIVKVVELAAIAAAVVPLLRARRARRWTVT